MSKIFIGTLPEDINEEELRDLFSKFGTIKFLSLKNPPRPPPYAFLEYVDEASASEAVREMHDWNLHGQNIRVEICRPSNREHTLSNFANRRYGSAYRIEVANLPSRVSWQDLKDIFRDVADVVHTEVDGKGRGIVSFRTPKDIDYAIRRMDGEMIHGQRIAVREEYQQERRSNFRYNHHRSRSRSYERNGRRERKRSISYDRRDRRDRRGSRSRTRDRPSRHHSTRHPSRSRSRSRSHSHSHSHSHSRSHSFTRTKRDREERSSPDPHRSPRRSPEESRSRSNSKNQNVAAEKE